MTRIDPNTIRVYVGDEDFVRRTMLAGVGNEAIGVELGMETDMSSGRLRAVDIDIAAPEGWGAYQGFLATGKLPEAGAAGTSGHTSSTASDELQASELAAHLGIRLHRRRPRGGSPAGARGDRVPQRPAAWKSA